ncbi:hypothetical protein [Hyphomonas sp.]|uniref:hypothetical protein n=1 Tax=Hyphomonas sp. TaxID=87 RepID=UPI00391ADE17
MRKPFKNDAEGWAVDENGDVILHLADAVSLRVGAVAGQPGIGFRLEQLGPQDQRIPVQQFFVPQQEAIALAVRLLTLLELTSPPSTPH